jgi:hypothetical protein
MILIAVDFSQVRLFPYSFTSRKAERDAKNPSGTARNKGTSFEKDFAKAVLLLQMQLCITQAQYRIISFRVFCGFRAIICFKNLKS